jgi:Trk K+ transport system NAD-binding subunit
VTVGEAISRHRLGILERTDAAGAAALFPPPDTKLEPGDRVIVQGEYQSLHELRPIAAE